MEEIEFPQKYISSNVLFIVCAYFEKETLYYQLPDEMWFSVRKKWLENRRAKIHEDNYDLLKSTEFFSQSCQDLVDFSSP